MLGLTLREEFRGKRLKGTAIELSNDTNTGATQIAAKEFLEITYPTHDLLKGIERDFTLHEVSANASELPGETNEFAQALGFGSRSQFQNNGGGLAHRLQPAHTECVDMPWKDCEGLINSAPNCVFWRHWPDSKVHDGAGAGQGLDTLTRDAADQLSSDDFWAFVERLATGRRLVITSDHGYAASSRSTTGTGETGPFVPPVALQINSPHGAHLLAVGRWKWKSQGGYPTLTHGGLSLLEALSPWIEISKNWGSL